MSFSKIPLGALPSPHDPRDYHITRLVPMLNVFPEEFVIPATIRVKDQGMIGSCVAHSLASCREIVEEKQLGVYTQFSVGFIYGMRADSDYQGEGMFPRQALSELVNCGVCNNTAFPYNEDYPTIKNLLQQQNLDNLLKDAAPHKISAYALLTSPDEVKTSLMQLGPVSIMIPVYNSFFYLNSYNAIVKYPQQGEGLAGYHEITIIGWRKDNTWIVLNSWGTSWGNNGICYMPFDFPITEMWAITDNIVPQPINPKYYRVQTGAYSVKENADKSAAKLKSLGYNTYVVLVNGLYKVQVGAFSLKDNAIKLANQLQSQGVNTFIVYY